MELRTRADRALEREFEQVQVGALDVVAEEIGRYFHREGGVHEGDRTDGLEPCVELLRINVVGNDLQTVVPHGDMSVLSGHEGYSDGFGMQSWGEKT